MKVKITAKLEISDHSDGYCSASECEYSHSIKNIL